MHVSKREFVFARFLGNFTVLAAEEAVEFLFLAPSTILVWSHHDGCRQIAFAHLGAYIIAVERVVIYHLLFDVVRQVEVGGIAVEVVLCDGHRALYLPAWMEQRIRNGVLVKDYRQHLCLFSSVVVLLVIAILLVALFFLCIGISQVRDIQVAAFGNIPSGFVIL